MPSEKLQNNLEKISINPDKKIEIGKDKKHESKVERNAEQPTERKIEDIIKEKAISLAGDDQGADIIATSKAKTVQVERKKEIDKILSNGLEDDFMRLPREKQIQLKEEGEKAVTEINKLLGESKTKIKKIIDIIKNWLSIIPGVNKFFLEQEAKIKTDKIMELKK